jgi:hypothetical protein
MLNLTDKELEFSTPLSSDTHGLKSVWMWLIMDTDWVLFTKAYTHASLKNSAFAIHLNNFQEKGYQDLFSSDELEKLRWLTNTNKEVVKSYNKGEIGVEELISKFENYSQKVG